MSQPIQPALSFDVDITWDDVHRFDVFNAFGTSWRRHYRRFFVIGFGLLAAVDVVQLFVFPSLADRVMNGLDMLLALSGCLAPGLTWDSGAARAMSDPRLAGFVGQRRITLDPLGVTCRAAGFNTFTPWGGIRQMTEVGGAVYLWDAPSRAFILPRSAFESAEAAARACEVARRLSRSAAEAALPQQPGGKIASPVFDLSESDLQTAVRPRSSLRPTRSDLFWAGSGALFGFDLGSGILPLQIGLGAAAAFGAWYWLGGPAQLRRTHAGFRAQIEHAGDGFQQVALGLDERSLYEASPLSQNMELWQSITQLDQRAEAAYFWNSRGGVYVLPRRAFDTDDDYFDFVERALEYRRAALAAA
jgi:hypothetical protein